MAEALCLVDSNILIRWVQPADPDYTLVEGALASLLRSGAILCYASQNLGEFWNASTRWSAMALAYRQRKPIDVRAGSSRD